jgi:alpha-tubulin suppressor-like RCC1 family protein
MTFTSNNKSGKRTGLVLLITAGLLAMLAGCSGEPSGSSKIVAADVKSPFELTDDGFSFPNFPSSQFQGINFDAADVTEMFGKSDKICIDAVAEPCVLTAEAAAWARMINQARSSGHCVGLVALASSRFATKQTPSTIKLPSDVNTVRGIMRAFSTQFLPEAQSAMNKWAGESLESQIKEIQRTIQAGQLEYTVGLYTPNGGHAVLPVAVTYLTPTTPRISLYDSNWPGQLRYMDADFKANTWRFSFSAPDQSKDEAAWVGSSEQMDLTPLSSLQGTCPFCGGEIKTSTNTLVIRTTNRAFSITNANGEATPDTNRKEIGIKIRELPAAASELTARDFVITYDRESPVSLSFTGQTSVVALFDNSIGSALVSNTSNEPIEFGDGSISTVDDAIELTLANGDDVIKATGFATTLKEDKDGIAATLTTASGRAVEVSTSTDIQQADISASSASGEYTVVARSDLNVVTKNVTNANGVTTSEIVPSETLSFADPDPSLPASLASVENPLLPSTKDRDLRNPTYAAQAAARNAADITTEPVVALSPTTTLAPVASVISDVPNMTVGVTKKTFVVKPSSNSAGGMNFASSDSKIVEVVASGKSSVTLLAIAEGQATITVNQEASGIYLPSSKTFVVTVTNDSFAPVITNLPDLNKVLGGSTFTIQPKSDSTGNLTFTSLDSDVVKISSTTKYAATLTIVGVGRATVRVNQAAQGIFLATSQTFTVTVTNSLVKATISDITDLDVAYKDPSFIVRPKSDSTGLMAFTSSSPAVVEVLSQTLNAVTLIPRSVGSSTITVTQAARGVYLTTTKTFKVTVGQATPTITGIEDIAKVYSDPSFVVTATSDSTGAISFTSSNSGVVEITATTGNKVTLQPRSVGSATITVNQAAQGSYKAVTKTFVIQVLLKTPSITATSCALIYGDPPCTISISGTDSDAPITYSSSNPGVIRIDQTTGETVVISVGTATLSAFQAEKSPYNASIARVEVRVNKPFDVANMKIIEESVDDQYHFGCDYDFGSGNSTGLFCWTASADGNRYGQLGGSVGNTRYTTAPNSVPNLTGVRSVNTAWDYVCVLVTFDSAAPTGGVKCWGHNEYGQLGNGTTTDSSTPVTPTGLGSGVKAIATGFGSACALLDDSSVKCWGNNNYGQLGVGSYGNSKLTPTTVNLGGAVNLVSFGAFHACAAMTAGGVKCWGFNAYRQLGDGLADDVRPVYVTSPQYVVGLEQSSGVTRDLFTQAVHNCALLYDKNVKCWGDNTYGLLGNGNTDPTGALVSPAGLGSGAVLKLTGGVLHNCVLLDPAIAASATNNVKCWGDNSRGQVGISSPVGPGVLLTTPTAVVVPDATSYTAQFTTGAGLGGGTMFTCAAEVDVIRSGTTSIGETLCWGANRWGELGRGPLNDSLTTVETWGTWSKPGTPLPYWRIG